MVGEDRVMMSGKELRRVHVIRQVMEQTLTQGEAGRLLGLTDRQIRRLRRRVSRRATGASCIGGEAVESTDRRASQGPGAHAVRHAVWGLRPHVGGGEVGGVRRDHTERGNATGLATRDGRDALPAPQATTPNVARAEGACRGVDPARWIAP